MNEMHTIVHGKVQGVWFRAWTRDTAKEMDVKGWVRNLADGNVEAVAQGDNSLLEQFLERLYVGPPLARVTTIDITMRKPEEVFSSFDVRK